MPWRGKMVQYPIFPYERKIMARDYSFSFLFPGWSWIILNETKDPQYRAHHGCLFQTESSYLGGGIPPRLKHAACASATQPVHSSHFPTKSLWVLISSLFPTDTFPNFSLVLKIAMFFQCANFHGDPAVRGAWRFQLQFITCRIRGGGGSFVPSRDFFQSFTCYSQVNPPECRAVRFVLPLLP